MDGNTLNLEMTDTLDIVDVFVFDSTGHFLTLLCQLCASG